MSKFLVMVYTPWEPGREEEFDTEDEAVERARYWLARGESKDDITILEVAREVDWTA
jgi:hypothetical protein